MAPASFPIADDPAPSDAQAANAVVPITTNFDRPCRNNNKKGGTLVWYQVGGKARPKDMLTRTLLAPSNPNALRRSADESHRPRRVGPPSTSACAFGSGHTAQGQPGVTEPGNRKYR